jgi:hypothetical protein
MTSVHINDDIDNPIPGQKYAIISFISPSDVIKDKNVFFFKHFLHQLLTEKEQEFDTMRNRLGITLKDDTTPPSLEETEEVYKDWMFKNDEKIGKQYDDENEFQTSVHSFKIRGVCDDNKDSIKRLLRRSVTHDKRQNLKVNIFCAEMGHWQHWDPEPHKVPDNEYENKDANFLYQSIKKNRQEAEEVFEEDVQNKKETARKNANEARRKLGMSEQVENVDDIVKEMRDNENERYFAHEESKRQKEMDDKRKAKKDKRKAKKQRGKTISDVLNNIEQQDVTETTDQTDDQKESSPVTTGSTVSSRVYTASQQSSDPWMTQREAGNNSKENNDLSVENVDEDEAVEEAT